MQAATTDACGAFERSERSDSETSLITRALTVGLAWHIAHRVWESDRVFCIQGGEGRADSDDQEE